MTLKDVVYREATARGCIKLRKSTIERIRSKSIEKGDVIEVTKIVAVQGAKKTWELLPLCHPIKLTHVDAFVDVEDDRVCVEVTVKAYEKTGVEMEALTAVALALLNVWDMVKKYEKDPRGQYPDTSIEDIRVLSKVKLHPENSPRT